jgi:hypothetical protein
MSEHEAPTPPRPPMDPNGSSPLPRWLVPSLVGAGVVIVALLVVIIVLLAGHNDDASTPTASTSGSASGSAEPKTFNVAGALTLIDAGNQNLGGGACQGSGGYDDIVEGAQVVVSDASGTTIAVGALGGGARDSSVECVFPFTIVGVPDAPGPFNVEVTHRGTIAFTRDNATSIQMSLG